MARALWARPAERERARQLARLAYADYAQAAKGAAVAEIDAWLRAPAVHLCRSGGGTQLFVSVMVPDSTVPIIVEPACGESVIVVPLTQ